MSPLKTARIKRGMSIYDLAKKAGIRAPTVSRIERGIQRTSAETASRLAKAVGISEVRVIYPERYTKAL